MPKTAPKEKYILLFTDEAKFNQDVRNYEDLQSTIKTLSLELAARFRKPTKTELDLMASGDTKAEIRKFVTDYYNVDGSPIKLSYERAIELMQVDMAKVNQIADVITSRQRRILKQPKISQYQYHARTPEQIQRYHKLQGIVNSIKELYEDNKLSLNNRFLPSFAIGSSNALVTNGIDLSVNYRWILNGG